MFLRDYTTSGQRIFVDQTRNAAKHTIDRLTICDNQNQPAVYLIYHAAIFPLLPRTNMRLTLLSKKATREMRTHSFLAFFLIYILLGCQILDATQGASAPQDNITRPAKDQVQSINRLREMIRGILKKRSPIPPVIEEKIHPPMDFYLDPPRFSRKDKSRLA